MGETASRGKHRIRGLVEVTYNGTDEAWATSRQSATMQCRSDRNRLGRDSLPVFVGVGGWMVESAAEDT
jgi:hypothetical protein